MKPAFFIGLIGLFFYSMAGMDLGEKKNEYFLATTRREPTIEERVVMAFDPFGRNVANNMLEISGCESGFNPEDTKSWDYALNNKNEGDALITGMTSWGLFMINAHEFEGWNTPEVNIQRAVQKYKSQGYHAWFNCSRKLGII